jgi:hypothetical protein
MEPELVVILASLVACTAGVAVLARLLGLGWLQAAVWALLATAGLATLVAGGLYASLAECLGEAEYGSMWHWEPRREICEEENSPAQLGYYALLTVPPLLAALGALLWSRGWKWAAYFASLPLLGVFFLPFGYIEALPYYPTDATPVLHDPYLRVAERDRPARACYVYGTADIAGPPSAKGLRLCVELAPTPEALALAPKRAEDITTDGLRWLGLTLTENGLEPGTEWDGLVAKRFYRLRGRDAREDSVLVRT